MYRHVCRHVYRIVCRHVCIDMCIGMCMGMCMDMCMDTCIDMWAGTCVHVCIGMRIDMCIGTCIDMCRDMHTDTGILMRTDMCANMCTDMWHATVGNLSSRTGQVGLYPCTQTFPPKLFFLQKKARPGGALPCAWAPGASTSAPRFGPGQKKNRREPRKSRVVTGARDL